MSDSRLEQVLHGIDAANGRDPVLATSVDGLVPRALLYGQRMSATLQEFAPGASEPLRIAARAQHIERWTVPRETYPEGRTGYLKWRKDLQQVHARRASEIMRQAGYGEEIIARTAALLRKEQLKSNAETQTLEDVVCLVFLAYEAADFIDRHPDEKVIDILAKTARKMSAQGLAAASRLALVSRLVRLLSVALSARDLPGD